MEDRAVPILGNHLKGMNIGLLVTGGIAAYKSPSLVRHLRSYGANVFVYVTPEAEQLVSTRVLEWSSLNPVVSNLSSEAEHLKSIDVYVVAPATYNTINKFALGIADNAVTTTLASALGKLERGDSKILIVPAMHGTMANSIYEENIQRLRKSGVEVIEPIQKWDKYNLPKTHYLVARTIRSSTKSPLRGLSVLLTAGPTPGRIDNVRAVTNRFRGRLGLEIAEELYLRGADVKLLLGASGLEHPNYVDTTVIRDFQQYLSEVRRCLGQGRKVDIGIFSAAVADYIPAEARPGKIPSKGELKSIPLVETPKVIQEVRSAHPGLFMVTFKYEERISRGQLEEIAGRRVGEGYQLVVANRGEEMDLRDQSAIIVAPEGVVGEAGSKVEIARTLLDLVEKYYPQSI